SKTFKTLAEFAANPAAFAVQHAWLLAGPPGLLNFRHVNVEGGLQRGPCSEVERTGCVRGDPFRRCHSVRDVLSSASATRRGNRQNVTIRHRGGNSPVLPF